MENRHAGEALVLAALGPSLNDVPASFFDEYPVMSCNQIPDRIPIDYWVGTGANMFETAETREIYRPNILRAKTAFVNMRFMQYYPYPNVVGIASRQFKGADKRAWSDKPLRHYGIGFTVVYVMLQLASYMGPDTILLVGLDHNYIPGKYHCHPDHPLIQKGLGPRYPDQDEWRKGADYVFRLAKKHSKSRIINISTQTMCNVFEKGKLEEWL